METMLQDSNRSV